MNNEHTLKKDSLVQNQQPKPRPLYFDRLFRQLDDPSNPGIPLNKFWELWVVCVDCTHVTTRRAFRSHKCDVLRIRPRVPDSEDEGDDTKEDNTEIDEDGDVDTELDDQYTDDEMAV